MTTIRRRQINELAEIIRKEANLKTPLTFKDLVSFVEELEGKVETAILDIDIDGIIKRNVNSFKIILNSANYSSDERKKFTLCHEIGHLFLHMKYLNKDEWEKSVDYEDTVYARRGYSEEEYDAHEFSAALLMPEDEYKKVVINNTNNGICNIQEVANHFAVSVEAAKNRGKWLGIFKW